MDDERKESDGSRSLTEPNTWRRSVYENIIDERAVTVTTSESSDGIREKAMRNVCIDELETGSSTSRWSSPGRAENDRTGKAKELVRSLVGTRKKEEDNIVASGSKSELWRDMSLKRAIQNWNMKYVNEMTSGRVVSDLMLPLWEEVLWPFLATVVERGPVAFSGCVYGPYGELFSYGELCFFLLEMEPWSSGS